MPYRGRTSAWAQRRLALTDLCELDRPALGYRAEDLRGTEADGRRRDARRLADPRDQVPQDPLDRFTTRPLPACDAISCVDRLLRVGSGVRRRARSPLRYIAVKETFDRLVVRAGVAPTTRHRPRLHDLRHTFAVRALQTGPADRSRTGAHMTALATYMGHVNIYSTYWYLEAAADVMRDVAGASEGFFVDGRQS